MNIICPKPLSLKIKTDCQVNVPEISTPPPIDEVISQKIFSMLYNISACRDETIANKICENMDSALDLLMGNRESDLYHNLLKVLLLVRDAEDGFGEWRLFYKLVAIWYMHDAYLIERLLLIVVGGGGGGEKMYYGSWKDVIGICEMLGAEHQLTTYCVRILNDQIYKDWRGRCVSSLAAKWAPRERTRSAWLFDLCVTDWITHYANYLFKFARTVEQRESAMKKGRKSYRKIVSQLTGRLIGIATTRTTEVGTLLRLNVTPKERMHGVKLPVMDGVMNVRTMSPHEFVRGLLKHRSEDAQRVIDEHFNLYARNCRMLYNFIPILDCVFDFNLSETFYSTIMLFCLILMKSNTRTFVLMGSGESYRIMCLPQTGMTLNQILGFMIDSVQLFTYLFKGSHASVVGVGKLFQHIAASEAAAMDEYVVQRHTYVLIQQWTNPAEYFNMISKTGNHNLIFWNIGGCTQLPFTDFMCKGKMCISGFSPRILDVFSANTIVNVETSTCMDMLKCFLTRKKFDMFDNLFNNLIETKNGNTL